MSVSTSEVQQFHQAFGEHTGISNRRRDYINDVRQLQRVKEFSLQRFDARHFTDMAWRLLGRYIAKNNHLNKIDLGSCGITDQNMSSLFYELTCSSSLTKLVLVGNSFGIDGLRSMVPFLQNSPNLSSFDLGGNNNMNTDCFVLLVQTLHGKPLEGKFALSICNCNIANISALDRYTLPNLQRLTLSGNNIGREGCITLSNMLVREDSNLSYLHLDGTGIDDEGAELLAASLENNTKLHTLCLQGNNITERGYKAFLKVMIDIRSIENTYNSNHTLKVLKLPPRTSAGMYIREIVRDAIHINYGHNTAVKAARTKVIRYQLNSQSRKEVCRLQDIEYISIGSLFADIEPILVPHLLALIGEEHGQCGFYQALVPMVPALMSCVDTSGMMKDLKARNSLRMAELNRQLAALSIWNDQLDRRLAVRESGDSRQSANTGSAAMVSAKKRQRS